MQLHEYHVINAEGSIIKRIHTSSKNFEVAYNKMKFVLKDLVTFCKLEYFGLVEK